MIYYALGRLPASFCFRSCSFQAVAKRAPTASREKLSRNNVESDRRSMIGFEELKSTRFQFVSPQSTVGRRLWG